jgi:hypothetical protein
MMRENHGMAFALESKNLLDDVDSGWHEAPL